MSSFSFCFPRCTFVLSTDFSSFLHNTYDVWRDEIFDDGTMGANSKRDKTPWAYYLLELIPGGKAFKKTFEVYENDEKAER